VSAAVLGQRARSESTIRPFIIVKAADEFRDKTTTPNQVWRTDFPYPKVITGLVVGGLHSTTIPSPETMLGDDGPRRCQYVDAITACGGDRHPSVEAAVLCIAAARGELVM
jgi:hypothetical protein